MPELPSDIVDAIVAVYLSSIENLTKRQEAKLCQLALVSRTFRNSALAFEADRLVLSTNRMLLADRTRQGVDRTRIKRLHLQLHFTVDNHRGTLTLTGLENHEVPDQGLLAHLVACGSIEALDLAIKGCEGYDAYHWRGVTPGGELLKELASVPFPWANLTSFTFANTLSADDENIVAMLCKCSNLMWLSISQRFHVGRRFTTPWSLDKLPKLNCLRQVDLSQCDLRLNVVLSHAASGKVSLRLDDLRHAQELSFGSLHREDGSVPANETLFKIVTERFGLHESLGADVVFPNVVELEARQIAATRSFAQSSFPANTLYKTLMVHFPALKHLKLGSSFDMTWNTTDPVLFGSKVDDEMRKVLVNWVKELQPGLRLEINDPPITPGKQQGSSRWSPELVCSMHHACARAGVQLSFV